MTFENTEGMSSSESVCKNRGSNIDLYVIIMSRAGRHLVIVLLLRLCGLEEVDALTTGSRPSPRNATGFAATPDGMLYVFGGYNGRFGIEGGSGRGVDWASCVGRRHAACTCRTAAVSLSHSLSCRGDVGKAREDM